MWGARRGAVRAIGQGHLQDAGTSPVPSFIDSFIFGTLLSATKITPYQTAGQSSWKAKPQLSLFTGSC